MKIVLFANTDWYLYNFRLPLAQALRERGNEVILVSPQGTYGQRLAQAGFTWVRFPLSRKGTNPLRELGTLWKLVVLFRQIRPDVVHLFTIKPVLYGSIAARAAGVEHIINAITGLGHVFTDESTPVKLLRWLVLRIYRFALQNTHVIFQNESDRELFVAKKLVSAEQAMVIPGSGVDIDKFAPKALSGSEEPIVLLPARLLKAKGVEEFVEAARQVKKEGAQARFVLVGDTDFDNPSSVSRQELENWQAEAVVEWWGWKQNMADVYAQTAIVCLPSYREGLSRTLLEAASCAKSIVTTDVPGCREVVRDGVNGFLVPIRNPQALANAILRLLADPKLRHTMGQRGRRLVVEQFSLARVIQETLLVYPHDHAGAP